MRKLLVLLSAVALLFVACINKTEVVIQAQKSVEVIKVEQATSYTYLLVSQNRNEYWMAVPKDDIQVGEVFIMGNFMEMKDFTSKDLGKTFEKILFVESLKPENSNLLANPESHKGNSVAKKVEVNIKYDANALTITELLKGKETYGNKEIVVKGKIVKVNHGIMNKSWYHIQDGTEFNGEFDITVTSENTELKVGDVVSFKGVLALNKDFGHGYFYSLIIENASIN